MAFNVPNRYSISKMTVWVRNAISSGAQVVPGRLPDMPNRVIGLIPIQGPGLVMESLFDVVAFQVQCRGAENNIEDAEAIALDLDNVILNAPDNFMIGSDLDGAWCNEIGRTGGAPSMQSPLPDSRSRFIFVCTYYAKVSTSVGQVN